MSKVIKIRKGLNIKLLGEAVREVGVLPPAARAGVSPGDFVGLQLRLLVAEGDRVEAGQALFEDKRRPEIVVVAPASGVVKTVDRGERRVIRNVIIEADDVQRFREFAVPVSLKKEAIVRLLLESGLWPCVVQRPYGIVACPDDTPEAIFVSGFDSAPLAPDMDFALESSYLDLKKGFEVLSMFAPVHLGLRGDGGIFEALDVEKHYFDGPHPAGNVGVQIANISPVTKGRIVWTLDIQHVMVIGRLFNSGRVDMTKTVAVTGSEAENPRYVRALAGAPIADMVRTRAGARVRYISGNPLSGTDVGEDGFLGFYANQLTVLPEGDHHEMLGWAMPRLNRFSVSRTYFSWLRPNKKYVLDTNLNGGHRPFIVSGLFEKYVPMDIFPVHLLKAIAAQDIDKMEALGIYEVVPEDLALCEFVDPSKNEIQQMVRDGINLIIKEMQ